MENQYEVFPTHIARAYWYQPGMGDFAPAQIPNMKSNRNGVDGQPDIGVCWLDELFQGGIFVPVGAEGRALTVLISGPPGTGKSTLATELCYRWQQANRRLTSTYVSTEAPAEWLINNTRRYKWKNSADAFTTKLDRPDRVRVLTVKDKKDLLSRRLGNESVVNGLCDWFGLPEQKSEMGDYGKESDVLVLDSLNTLPTSQRAEPYEKFQRLAYAGFKILIMVLDSGTNDSTAEFWDFTSDIVIRLGRNYARGYMIRTIEIVKARFQAHVWGVHQLKIYEPYEEPLSFTPLEKVQRRLRAHPFRKEGGLFIFLHFRRLSITIVE